MRRRELLQWLAVAGGSAGVLVGRGSTRMSAASGRSTVASTWDDVDVGVSRTASVESIFVSAVHRADYPFMAVGVQWPFDVTEMSVRVKGETGDWSSWLPVSDHESHAGPDYSTSSGFRGLQFVPLSRFIQYRYRRPLGQSPVRIRLTLIDSTNGPTAPVSGATSRSGFTTQSGPAQTVISRSGWGANESYRYDSSGNVSWPPEYRITQKGIVHHTVTDTGGNDPASVVRAIYYYHAITLGWGDIGYNFLVDWLGNIYEGRYGGPYVVGGHAAQYNYGSVGVACIGDFTSVTIPDAMERSLARLLAWKCGYLDPHGNAYFIDNVYPSIAGHRDFDAGLPSYYKTTCPGDALYGQLAALRGDVLWNLDNQVPVPSAQLTGVTFQPTSFPTSCGTFGGTLQVRLTVKNVGTGTLITQGPPPGTTFKETDTFRSLGYAEINGTWRAGVQLDPPGSALGVDHPYRWGLPDALEPGQSVSISGQIVLTNRQSRTASSGVVQEGVGWSDWPNTTTISIAQPTSSSPPPTSNLTSRVYLPMVASGPKC